MPATTTTTKSRPPAPQPVTALELLRHEQASCVTYLPLISLPVPSSSSNNTTTAPDWLKLPPGLYQLVGCAGSGKSQIALSLCLDAAAAAANNDDENDNDHTNNAPRAFYISLKGRAHLTKLLQRLQQMAHARQSPQSPPSPQSQDLLQRILTRSLVTAEELFELTTQQSVQQVYPPTVRLVVLDSVADVFRAGNYHYDESSSSTTFSSSHHRRSAQLLAVAAHLHQWAYSCQVPVLVINQVSGSSNEAALGSGWAHAMPVSFGIRMHESGGGRCRRLLVLCQSAGTAIGSEIEFGIETAGVVLCHGPEQQPQQQQQQQPPDEPEPENQTNACIPCESV